MGRTSDLFKDWYPQNMAVAVVTPKVHFSKLTYIEKLLYGGIEDADGNRKKNFPMNLRMK